MNKAANTTVEVKSEGGAVVRLDDLSFIKRNPGRGRGYNYWADVPALDYVRDCDTGNALAEEFALFMAANRSAGVSSLLTEIVAAMEANGATNGHRVGFFSIINRYAAAAAFVRHSDEWRKAEHPTERVNRLAAELSEALNEHADKRFHAVVYPSQKREYAIAFLATAECNDVTIPIEVERLEAKDRAYWHLKKAAHAMRDVSGKSLWFTMSEEYTSACIYAYELPGGEA
ncbi:hypothetical protein [Rhizobium sp. TRM96650]|nr:hypothetical protein [Rhizobium sp. TRM96650]